MKSYLSQFVIPLVLCVALTVVGHASADPIRNPGNGHYYEVFDGSLDWGSANAAAQALTFMGTSGHLVTITSAQENLFLTNTFGSAALQGHWTGGNYFFPVIDPPGPLVLPALVLGGGSWVTGEPFNYTNWSPGMPSMANGPVQGIIFGAGTSADGQLWDSVPIFLGAGPAPAIRTASVAFPAGYVVEFDVAATPEPTTAGLMGLGILVLAGGAWWRRNPRDSKTHPAA
jgi:hypothetical protein